MAAATVNMNTHSDADYVKSFMLSVSDGNGGTYYYDFTDMTMAMMIRKRPEDAEVFVSLTTNPGDGIVLWASNPATPDYLDTIQITIRRDQLAKMPEGDYAQSLIMYRLDGIADDIWRGTLTHAVGPTR